mmetsp:Transcript_3028/g.7707  ORF Transcript_3028/g.7707 Transcript_3028/m.7707 type:complete len:215 (+) Transcript_3028:1778-2422(+)
MPTAASPTTPKPMQAPAVNATCSPSFNVFFAQATVVRTLPSVATDMPTQPEMPLRRAPTTRQAADRIPSVPSPSAIGLMVNMMSRRIVHTTTYPERYLYSSFKKALEPDLTLSARMSNFGLSIDLPTGCAMSFAFSTAKNISEMRPAKSSGATATTRATYSSISCNLMIALAISGRHPLVTAAASDSWTNASPERPHTNPRAAIAACAIPTPTT